MKVIVQTNRLETKSSQLQIEETGFDMGDPVLFFPITNSTRRNIAPYLSLMDVKCNVTNSKLQNGWHSKGVETNR